MEFEISEILEENIEEIHILGISGNKYSVDGGKNCFWPKETISSLIKSKMDVTLKLVVGGKIVGFSLVMIHPFTKKAIIENFFILYKYKNLEKEFFYEVENKIKENGAQFMAYYFNIDDDSNSIELFKELNFFEGGSRKWLHKNISFFNPLPNNKN